MVDKPIQSWNFASSEGNFMINDPHHTSYLYFPLVNEAGMMSVVTPTLHGDAKISQHAFLLPRSRWKTYMLAVSIEIFWVTVDGVGVWSATGNSALQLASDEDELPSRLVFFMAKSKT